MKKKKINAPDTDSVYDNNSVASATECTGITPAPPIDEFESESYENLGILLRERPNENVLPPKEDINYKF